MCIMADRQLLVSQTIYNYQIEKMYWDRYIYGLEDFIRDCRPKKEDKLKIEHEITRVKFHIFKLQTNIENYLKGDKSSKEFEQELKKFLQ